MANDYVFVVDRKGNPLMPTKRRGRVRHLLKEGKAVVIKTHPFTVKMKYDVGHYTQPMYEGIDSGRMKRNIFVCTGVNFDGKDKHGSYCAAENHIGYDNGKGNGNRKAKFCTVLDSGCLQCTGIERTDDYIAHLSCNRAKADKTAKIVFLADDKAISNRILPQSMNWSEYRSK